MARKATTTPAASSRWRPNFAFDHAAARGLPKDGEPPLDLSVRQVRSSTAASRSRPPRCAGSTRRSLRTASSRRPSSRPTAWPRRRCSCRPLRWTPPEDRLRRPRRVEHRHASSRCPPIRRVPCAQAGAGKVGIAEWAAIVDYEHRHRAARRADRRDLDQRPEHGHRLLGQDRGDRARLSRTSSSRGPTRRTPRARPTTRPWVRTGDLGAYHDGELFITGRVKDLVIIDGRNHYPQDLEYSAQESTKALRVGYRRGVLGARQPAARRGVRERARRSQARPRRHLRAAGDRRRARTRRAQARRWARSPTTSAPPSRCATA